MKVIDDGSGHDGIRVDDSVVDALHTLGKALAATDMSARIRLSSADGSSTLDLMLGKNRSGGAHVLRARSSTGEGSRLGIDETEGY